MLNSRATIFRRQTRSINCWEPWCPCAHTPDTLAVETSRRDRYEFRESIHRSREYSSRLILPECYFLTRSQNSHFTTPCNSSPRWRRRVRDVGDADHVVPDGAGYAHGVAHPCVGGGPVLRVLRLHRGRLPVGHAVQGGQRGLVPGAPLRLPAAHHVRLALRLLPQIHLRPETRSQRAGAHGETNQSGIALLSSASSSANCFPEGKESSGSTARLGATRFVKGAFHCLISTNFRCTGYVATSYSVRVAWETRCDQ